MCSDVVERGRRASGDHRAQLTFADCGVGHHREGDRIGEVPSNHLSYFRGRTVPVPFCRSDVATQ